MAGKNSLIWIEKGFEIVAYNGFDALNIESLSKAISKNKSSFYHYFGSLDVFTTELLNYHTDYSKIFSQKASDAEKLIPDVIHVFLEEKNHIFFHKQLQIKRENPEFKACFERVFDINQKVLADKFEEFFELDSRVYLKNFMGLIFENFLMNITPETYSYQWIEKYLREMYLLKQHLSPQ